MRPSRRLTKLEHTALSYVSFLRTQASAALMVSDAPSDRILAFAIVEAHNAWTLFVRSFYLSCIFSARRRNGVRVSSNLGFPRTTVIAIDRAMQVVKPGARGVAPWPRRDEPAWQTPNTILRLSQAFAFSNFAQITAALSYPTSVFSHLRDFRHFFSHRNEETINVALRHSRAYGVAGLDHPKQLLRAIGVGRPQPIVLDWMDDLSNVIELMCD
jgi:hypothetical protein